jgi:nicotinic acid mononucleotide adenylyltransferase
LKLLEPFLPADQRAGLASHLVHMPQCEISSSAIRQAVANRRSIRYQVTPAVAAYIEQHQLYRP